MTTYEDDPIPERSDAPPLHSSFSTVSYEVTAAVVRPEDGPAECTLFPADATDEEVVTTWITAQEGSFVDVESMR
ncbi:hypothetical protein VB773_04030 [Haloarculaceae archaeon H-GB2-1]|nr:hypothetical protein [Haloarculaceae archaeon H-GB1-1]MEA5388771.1 hypothetical protein [Haloarculaceae archaeon H-GB11]MEA5406827.1 hypothetical protein [Haloarculaceae archaeon H-GB2-1]